ncbi:MAG: RNase adapter RapZ [Oscillospiraceae bacterium]|nr:RNase adapter RapZ [Oscillospiraceae bacterium]
MEILLISGLSGSGKSRAASFLEDMGFYIVDNMPAGMILKFAEFCAVGSSRYSRVALVYDVRTAESFDEFLEVLDTLRRKEYDCKLLFLEADVSAIIKRYKETRRIHPLQEQTGTLESAVNREIALMHPVREQADMILNSTTYSTARLKGELVRLFGGSSEREDMAVSVVSFGFKHGIPLEADLMFDVRFMPNPFYIDNLRPQTGLDAPVRDYVFSFRETEEFMEKLRDMISYLLPRYREEGKTVLVIAIGCTGGHHRSVAITHALSQYITSLGYRVTENHRDMTRM